MKPLDDTKVAYGLVEIIGAVIRLERELRGIPQNKLASIAGIHSMQISKLERGVQSNVGVVTLTRIAAGLSSSGMPISASEILVYSESYLERLNKRERPGESSAIVAVRQLISDDAREATRRRRSGPPSPATSSDLP